MCRSEGTRSWDWLGLRAGGLGRQGRLGVLTRTNRRRYELEGHRGRAPAAPSPPCPGFFACLLPSPRPAPAQAEPRPCPPLPLPALPSPRPTTAPAISCTCCPTPERGGPSSRPASAQPVPQTPPAPQLLHQPLPLQCPQPSPSPDACPRPCSPSPPPPPPSCFPTSHGGWFALAASLPPAAMTSGAGKS